MARLAFDFIGGSLDDGAGTAGLTAGQTDMDSPALAALPAIASPDYLPITLNPDGLDLGQASAAPELVWITAHTASATTATIARGKQGTTATDHPDGTDWNAGVYAADIGSGLFEIETVELTGSATSISFSSIPATYRDLVVIGELRSDRASQLVDGTLVRVGNGTVDSGANYRRLLTQIRQDGTSIASAAEGQTAGFGTPVPGATADAGIFGAWELAILKYADSARNRHFMGHGVMTSDATDMRTATTGSVWANVADVIDVVTVLPEVGTNFITGSYLTLYGRGRA